MTKDEALRLALDALEVAQDNLRPHEDNCFLHDEGEYNRCFCGKDSLSNHLQSVIEALEEALRQAIEQAEKQEPVAYGFQNTAITGGYRWMMLREKVPADDQYNGALWTPLYTTPPAQPAPVQEPLSRETVMQMAHDVGFDLDPTRNMLIEVRGQHAQLINLARSIEAAHGITKRK